MPFCCFSSSLLTYLELDDLVLYKYDEQKAMKWLCGKVSQAAHMLMADKDTEELAFGPQVPEDKYKSHYYRMFAISLLSEYISDNHLKHLEQWVKDSSSDIEQEESSSQKRPLIPIDYFNYQRPRVSVDGGKAVDGKKQKTASTMSHGMKRLQKVDTSKMKKMTDFFKPKKSSADK